MRFGRRRDDAAADEGTEGAESTKVAATPTAEAAPEGHGPWDSSQRSTTGDPAYVDLGPLKVRVRLGMNLQAPRDDDGSVGGVVLVTEDSGLELRAYAAPRGGGLWDEVRVDLAAEVGRHDGESAEVEGPFGTELHVRVPVALADGEQGFQPSRVLGIEGPRWLLRATFLGRAALEPADHGLLWDALQDVVVDRGTEPRVARERLVLDVAPEASGAAPDAT